MLFLPLRKRQAILQTALDFAEIAWPIMSKSLKTTLISRFPLSVLLLLSVLHAESGWAQYVKCGTGSLLQLGLHKAALQPTLPLSRISGSGLFEIHYSSSGVDAVENAFLDSAEAILETLWRLQVDSLGYDPPPTEADGRIHLYISQLGETYGYTVPEANHGTRISSYMVCDNDFLDPAYPTQGLDGLRVTLAHELFHVIHFGYRVDPDELAFYEWCSTWMEDVAFDQINDYVWYLYDYYERAHIDLTTFDGRHEYAAALYIHMIDQAFGADMIRRVWRTFAAEGGRLFELSLEVLAAEGIEPRDAAATFLAWNLFTGERSVEGFGYRDAPLYDALTLSTPRNGRYIWDRALGVWGIFAGELPGGVQGQPGLEVDPESLMVALTAVRNGSRVQYLSSGDPGDLEGDLGYVGVLSMQIGQCEVTAMAYPERTGLPESIEILAIYPNPFNSLVNWEIGLDRPGIVELELFNLLGRLVARRIVTTGRDIYVRSAWNGVDNSGHQAASGMYILRVSAGGAAARKKMILVR